MNNRASFIEIVTATFAAGESRLFALTGQYFEIIDATFPVDVTLSDFYGAQRGLMRAAEASFNLKNTEFGVIQITSASAQTIRFAYGTGEAGTRRAAGAVSIVGTVPVDLVQSDIEALTLPTAADQFSSQTALMVAGTAVNIFTPASNSNGAIIWSACASDRYTAAGLMALVAKNSAPASVDDGEVLALSHVSATATPNYVFLQLERPMRLAAGLGLWWISNQAGGVNSSLRSARYKLL